MAVLVEAFSVIVRTQAIKEKHIGGFASFIKDIPNETICTDGFLVRVGFMCFDDALFYGAELIAKGLHRPPEHTANSDIAYAVQDDGIVGNCSWLNMERFIIDNPDKTVTACSLINTTPVGLFVPTNWSYDQYASLRKINQEELSQSELLGDSSVHKIQDKKTLENLYIGRTSLSASKDHPLQ